MDEVWFRAGKRINVRLSAAEYQRLQGLGPAEYDAAVKRIRAEARGSVENMTTDAREIADHLIACFQRGGKALVCGNGGSAAQAIHFAAELIGRFETERRSLPCICLNADQAILTAIGNDYGFKGVFARQVAGLAREGDVLLLLTTSGESENLIYAAVEARSLGVTTIALSGRDGGELITDHQYIAQGGSTATIQENHLITLHQVCRHLDEAYT